jgi:hypothetical protein
MRSSAPWLQVIGTIGLSATLLATGVSAADECPPNEMHFGGGTAVFSTEATFDSTYAPPGYVGHFRAAYDLQAGRLDLYQCCSLGVTSVTTHDTYDVEGVPSGTPVALWAEMVVDGAVFTSGCGGSGCGGVFSSSVRHGADLDEGQLAAHLFNGREEFHDVLRIPVTIVAGQPEEIEFELWGRRSPGGSHGSEGTGQIQFVVQQTGIRVISCQSFGGQPVPTRVTTWGRLKATYR